MSTKIERILLRYERLGAGPEMECFLSLYRCLKLEERLAEMPAACEKKRKARRSPARRSEAA